MACCGPTKPKKKRGYDEWEVESAASTLRRASEVRMDPKLHELALKELEKEKEATEIALRQNAIEEKADKGLKKVFGEDD